MCAQHDIRTQINGKIRAPTDLDNEATIHSRDSDRVLGRIRAIYMYHRNQACFPHTIFPKLAFTRILVKQ